MGAAVSTEWMRAAANWPNVISVQKVDVWGKEVILIGEEHSDEINEDPEVEDAAKGLRILTDECSDAVRLLLEHSVGDMRGFRELSLEHKTQLRNMDPSGTSLLALSLAAKLHDCASVTTEPVDVRDPVIREMFITESITDKDIFYATEHACALAEILMPADVPGLYDYVSEMWGAFEEDVKPYLEDDLPKARQAGWDILSRLVDVYVIRQIMRAPEPVVVFYGGENHAQRIAKLLRNV